MAIAANSLRSERFGQGWGSLERNSLLSKEAKGQPHKTTHPGLLPLGSCRRAAAAIETPGVHTELKLNTHPARGRQPGSACCRGRHGNMPGAGQRETRRARGYSLHRGAPGCRVRCCVAHRRCSPLPEPGALAAPRRARGGARSVSPPRPHPLLPLRVESERSGSLSSQPANKTGSNWIMLFVGR